MGSIGWLVSNVLSGKFSEVTNTELASSRLRAGVCINSYLKNGYDIYPLNLLDGRIPEVVFISKFVPDSGTGRYIHDGGVRYDIWMKLANKIKNHGSRIILDYTDNHLSQPTLVGDFYRSIAKYVDAYTVPSNKMKGNLSDYVNKPIFVIPEPIEVSILPPKLNMVSGSMLNILWFGHNSNLPYLYEFILNRLIDAPNYHLVVMSDQIDINLFRTVINKGPKNMKYSYAKWSVQLMEKISRQTDLCLIPGSVTDPKKNGVSSGRLITSLALGLPTIAAPLDAYLPYVDYFVRADSDLTSILDNPSLLSDAIMRAQKEVLPNYSQKHVGELWCDLYRRMKI